MQIFNSEANVSKELVTWICPEERRQYVNPLNAELNSICYLLALLGAHHILHVSRIRVNLHYFNTFFHKVGALKSIPFKFHSSNLIF